MMAGEPRFGTDGIRGTANEDLTPALALKLGIAAAHVLSRHMQERHVIVGRDTRVSGDMLEAALNAGLAATGCRVTNVGVVPTPAVSHMTVRLGAAAGAIISASHNPYPDNGIKFLGPDGCKLPDALEDEIATVLEDWEALPRPTGIGIGRISDSRAPVVGYVAHVAATAGGPLDGYRLVVDCANGANWELAPALFADLGADVQAIHASPDGVNINKECGSTKPQSMCARVREFGADAGLAFDGDGDRVMMCDEMGQMLDGDRMMAICATGMQRRGDMRVPIVIGTVMSNAGLDVALERIGLRLQRTDVGDRYVAEEMNRVGASIGGEQSGHVLFARLTRTGDGMVTGLQVLKEMRDSGQRLSELGAVMETYPQLLRNVRVRDREAWRGSPKIDAAIEAARARLDKPEWLSVRASGTEPLVRVMAQGTDQAVVKSIVDDLCDRIARFAG